MSKANELTDTDVAISAFSHEEVKAFILGEINELIKDPLLADVPANPTLDEVRSRIALERGDAFRVNLRRYGETDEIIPIVIEQEAKVCHLKEAIQRTVALKLRREDGPSHLSWRYVWKTYWLTFKNEKLSDDKKSIREYGITDGSEINFIKRLRRK